MDAARELAQVGEAGVELGARLPQQAEHGLVVAEPALDERSAAAAR